MGEDAAALKDIADQVADILQVKGKEAWSEFQGKLAELAASDDPRRAFQALLEIPKDASSEQALLRTLAERISVANPDLLKSHVLFVAHELNMTPLGDSEPLHMVDCDSNFCQANVDGIIKCSPELSAADASYSVVSIVGAQSSGKSYLLNRLFGTKFKVMDPKYGRRQTTRGIMISRCIGPSLLLLDVEGFDGKERGQDTLFENQAALFALTVSDLMMVNMSVFDIGREKGGATTVFKTIFQERSKLPPGFTKMLVLLRHYDGEPSLDIMGSDIMEHLEQIWKSVNMESVKFKDYIEVNIFGLPDRISPEFPNEVTRLRKLVSSNKSAKVPASGFSISSSRFWETIQKNKELNIQSHKVAVARQYCKQLVEDKVSSLKFQETNKLLEAKESPQRFKQISHELMERIKTEYDQKTKMYDPDVRDTERQYLVEKLHEIFKDVSRPLVWEVQENTLEQFKREFDARTIKNMQEAGPYLSKYVDKFMSSCEDLKGFGSDHLYEISGVLKNNLESYTAISLKDERDKKEMEKVQKYRRINLGLDIVKNTTKVALGVVYGDIIVDAIGSVAGVVGSSIGPACDLLSSVKDHLPGFPSASQD